MAKKIKVLESDYHRNGVGGEGFYVSIVDDPAFGRMLVIDFSYEHRPRKPKQAYKEWKAEEEYNPPYGFTAVLNLDEAATGNIYMFGNEGHLGGNAWRGDRLGDTYRPLIKEFNEDNR